MTAPRRFAPPPTPQQILDAELAEIASGKATACKSVNTGDSTLICQRISTHQQDGVIMREAHALKSNPNDDSTWVTWV